MSIDELAKETQRMIDAEIDSAMAAIMGKHPGWKKIVLSHDYQEWLARQAPGVTTMARPWEPLDVIDVLDRYTEFKQRQHEAEVP